MRADVGLLGRSEDRVSQAVQVSRNGYRMLAGVKVAAPGETKVTLTRWAVGLDGDGDGDRIRIMSQQCPSRRDDSTRLLFVSALGVGWQQDRAVDRPAW